MGEPVLGTRYILTMHCISGDNIQVEIHRYEDIFRWLKTLDHEGSVWDVVSFDMDEPELVAEQLTDQVLKDYEGNRGV